MRWAIDIQLALKVSNKLIKWCKYYGKEVTKNLSGDEIVCLWKIYWENATILRDKEENYQKVLLILYSGL